MKFNVKTLAAAAALALSSTYGVAGPTSVFDPTTLTFGFSNTGIGAGVGVSDTFTLSAPELAPGVYSILGSFSATNFTLTSATVNGVAYTPVPFGAQTFGLISFTDSSPFEVNVTGFTGGASGVYSGELVLTAVPEPETYALMLGGLGALAFVARRRRSA